MRIALIAEHFPPMRTSCAVQMRDLAREFKARGLDVTVLVPSHTQDEPWLLEDFEGIEVVRLKAPATRDRNYLIRVFGEFVMPFSMLRNFRASPANHRKFDGIAWYSPSIFFGALIYALKRQHQCPTFLILRDIFPQWAADLGVLRRGPAYHMLDQVARFQYSVADTIGVQSPGDLKYFADAIEQRGKRVEVLQNWMRPQASAPCSIDLSNSSIAGRQIFVYAGNMGLAQGMDKLLDLATSMREEKRAGFVFVGRGGEAAALKEEASRRKLDQTFFFDEIDPDEIPGLYAQCSVGLVALDARHKAHNIPGKFISYMHAGLPVLAAVNQGNDLVELIHGERVGFASIHPGGTDLPGKAEQLLDMNSDLEPMGKRAHTLAKSLFSAARAAEQIQSALGLADGSMPATRPVEETS